jgi:hypothetical protein
MPPLTSCTPTGALTPRKRWSAKAVLRLQQVLRDDLAAMWAAINQYTLDKNQVAPQRPVHGLERDVGALKSEHNQA